MAAAASPPPSASDDASNTTPKRVALVTWRMDNKAEEYLTPPEFAKWDDGSVAHVHDVLLAAKLRGLGVEVAREHWDDPAVEWSRFDMVLIRTPWDYQHHLPEFLAWADSVGDKLVNPPAVLHWNTDKGYLLQLAEAGVPVVPSQLVDAASLESHLAASTPGTDCILKPAVGASAMGVVRYESGTEAGKAALTEGVAKWGRVLVQPFQPSVKDPGEFTAVFTAGKLIQVVVKVPASSSIFVHEHLGGQSLPSECTEDMKTLFASLETALGSLPATAAAMPLLYMRVDMLLDEGGKPRLSELEVFEPNLYWHVGEGKEDSHAEAYAAAVVARLHSMDVK